MQGRLLAVAGVRECLVGLAFLLSPGITTALLLGAQSDSVGLMIGRVAGVALLSLGIACLGARADAGGAARMGTLRAITLYNAGAGLLRSAPAECWRSRHRQEARHWQSTRPLIQAASHGTGLDCARRVSPAHLVTMRPRSHRIPAQPAVDSSRSVEALGIHPAHAPGVEARQHTKRSSS